MGLVGTVVDAAIGWLVQSILASFFTGQMEVWTREVGLAEDVEKLKREMRNMQMVLAAAEGRRIDNRPLSWSLDDLKELLYDAEDVMDELDYYRLQQQIEEGKGCNAAACTNPEGSCVSSSTPSYFKLVSSTMNRIISWATHGRKRKREEEEPTHSTMLPLEIKHDISERIIGIVNRLRTIGNSVQGVLQLETSRPIATSNQSQSVAWNTRLTTSVPFECKVYGRDAERDKIIELLINGKSSDLHVLPVVGIGGVGKTTLARFVYGDQRIKDHFELHMWVCVSTNFDKVRLTIEILEHVCKDRQGYKEISSFNVLQEILSKYIRNKRFLLVLDDMWEDKDRSGWDKLLAPLKSNQATGCMILATTRSTYVAEMIGTMGENKLIKVNGLDEKEFWLFFKACAFGSSVHLLGFLLTLCEEAKTLRFLRVYVTGADVGSILSILKPCHLRYLEFVCVSTTNIFEYEVYNNTAFPQALTRFYHLQVLDVDNSGNLAIPTGMNNLVNLRHLKLKFKVQNSSNFESLEPTTKRTRDVLDGLEPHQNLEHLQITRYCGATSPTWLASNVSVTSLQTLHLESCREWRILPSIKMLPLLKKLGLVRMWNLMEVSIPSLEELVLVNMPKLEKCIGTYGLELTSHLRVLMVKDCPQLNEFTLFQSDSSFQAEQKSWFPSLEELTIGHCPHIIKWEILPLREMRALKELQLMDVHIVRVLSVPSLEKLELIKMPGLESCSGLTASPPLQFSPSQVEENEWLSSLRKLIIHDCPSLMVSHPLPPSAHIFDFSIKAVSTFPSIQINYGRLTIESNELSVLDDKILAFHNLGGMTSLSIQNCPNLISISSEGFSQLTALEYLRMENCPNLLSPHVMSEAAPENSTAANSLVLPSLKSMFIWSCGITGGWLTQMLPHLQSLDELRIGRCPRIKWLSNSQRTETEGSSSLASAATAEASSAQDELLLKVPSNILYSLKRLVFSGCPDVEFCGGNGSFGGFTPLEELFIYDCPKLISSLVSDTKDGSNMDVGLLPPSLKKLRISHLPENMQSYFPKGLAHLKSLDLGPCPYLKRVQLQSCTDLEELTIYWCEQLGVLEGLQFLSSLRSLEIEMNSELSATWDLKLHEQEQSLNQIGLLPPSLEVLRISNLTDEVQSRLLSCLPAITELAIEQSPKLTSLQLGYCTALKELEIINCELLASIEGFECIRNLRSLKVCDFPSLPLCLELVSQHQGACELWSQLEILETGDASVLTMFLCKHLTSLRRLRFWCCGRKHRESMVSLTEEQERALQLLTSLQELIFWGYPNLLSLPANLQSLTSLERLGIFNCPSISRLPEMGLPPSLKQLQLHRCSEELLYKCRMAAAGQFFLIA